MEELKVRVIVDKRERDFPTLFAELGAEVEEKMLELGDFLCSDRTVVERKTRMDFEASVLDLRLFTQLSDLTKSFENVIVVVEGERTDEGPLTRAALMGAYAAVMTDFGASIFFTRNEKATAELVYCIAKHEQLAKKIELRISPKRRTSTLSQAQRSVAEMLPMVGPNMAKKLLEHFGDLQTLFNASEEQLMEVEGLGEKKAKAIYRTVRNSYDLNEDS